MMDSIYVFTGKDLFRMEERLHALLIEKEVPEDEQIWIDGENPRTFSMSDMLLQCSQASLFSFGMKKAVICQNPYFLSPTGKAAAEAEKKNNQKLLLGYLKQPDPDTILIFYCHGFDADARKKEYKDLKANNAVFLTFTPMKPWEFEKYADERLMRNGFRLTADAREELFLRTNHDTLLLHQALVKLSVYGQKQLMKQDIEHLVSPTADSNIFRLSDAFLRKDIQTVMTLQENMQFNGYSPIALISLLGGRLRTMYQIKRLQELGLSADQIATRLRLKAWSVNKSLDQLVYYSSRQLLGYLRELADLDQQSKAGLIDAGAGWENFLLEYGRKYAGNS